MQKRPLRIGITGSLCDNDLVMGEYLRRLDVACVIFRPQGNPPKLAAAFYGALRTTDIQFYHSPFDLLRKLSAVDYVFSFSAVLPMWLGKLRFLYPLCMRIGWPKYATIGTGSSLSEAIVGRGLRPRLARWALRKAAVNIANNYPHVIKNVIRYKIPNVVFMPLVQPDVKRSEEEAPVSSDKTETIFFHPSHLDWGVTDNKEGRNSTKGNDRFIRAFARLIRSGENARLIILDRGPDRHLARQLVNDLELQHVVSWRRELSREEYWNATKEADVIVDQFDVGAFGGIAWEAMCLGKPVITYVDTDSNILAYWDNAPVLNAQTEDEIFAQLKKASDKSVILALVEQSKEFVARYNGLSLVKKYLVYAEIGTCRKIFRYGLD